MSDKPNNVPKEAAEKAASPDLEILEKCSCGHDRTHYMVSTLPTYTGWGTFWITLLGISAVPIRLDFKCRVCGEVFDFIRDPEELKKFL